MTTLAPSAQPSQKITRLILGLALIAFGVYIITWGRDMVVKNDVHSYTECVAAGNPILKTEPAQCQTPNGRTFTQDPNPNPPTGSPSASPPK